MFKRAVVIKGRIKCPYCGRIFKPRVFTDPLIKECPHCHRYFYYQAVRMGAEENV